MVPIRIARGTGALRRGLQRGQSGYCFTDGRLVTQRLIATVHVFTPTVARELTVRSSAVAVRRHGGAVVRGVRQQEAVCAVSWVVHRGRCFSGRSRGPPDERRGGMAKEEGKAPYTFLEKGDREQLDGDSKNTLETGKVVAEADEREAVVDAKNMTMWQRITNAKRNVKLLWKHYGVVAIGTYVFLYLGGFGGMYALLATGVVQPDVDTSAVLRQIAEWTGDNDFMRWLQHQVETSPNCEKLIMAFVANEIIEYPRDALVLVATPAIARAIGRAPPKATKKAH